MHTWTASWGLAILFLFAGIGAGAEPPKIKFIANKCQWEEPIHFAARIQGGSMQIKSGGFGYTFIDQNRLTELHEQGHTDAEVSQNTFDLKIQGHQVNVNFIGSNKNVSPLPFGRQPEYYNYFLGTDSTRWSSGVEAFEGAVYRNVYEGIDLKVYAQGNHVKYDFTVAAGVDPSQIQFMYRGADLINLHAGDLIVHASKFSFIEKKPIAYQFIKGKKIFIECEYVLTTDRVHFNFPDAYDACYPLVIDPLLIFSTFSGSTADNWGSTATPGERGTLYSSGVTNHHLNGNFPATPGAFQVAYGGAYDVAILKYDSTGSQLLYASYLGGSDNESPHSLVMNSKNELLVLGTTSSFDFPTTSGVIGNSFNGGTPEANVIPYFNGSDLFLTKISANGSQLLASTYLGGSANDGLNPQSSPLVANYGDELRGDLITDVQDNIYISSVTSSFDFPASNSFGLTYNGGITDALIININANLTQIFWAAFLGGNAADASHTIKTDAAGNLLVAGGTSSANFPTTSGVYQTTYGGSVDGWMSKMAGDGSAILISTFTGTSTFNQVYFIDLDLNNNVYVYGQTTGAFPITTGVYANANSGQFLQKFNQDLTTLQFSTVFGAGRGIPDISPTAFLVNDCNNIYMSGWGGLINSSRGFWNSGTQGMPVTADAIQKNTAGSDFYFIVLTDDATELLYATFLGGNQSPTHVDGGTSRFDKGGIVYHAVCAGCGGGFDDFPTTANAWSRQNLSLNCNNAAFKFDLSSLKARIQTNTIKFDMPGITKVCMPDAIVFQNKSTGGQFYEWDFGDGGQFFRQDTAHVVHVYEAPGTYRVKLLAVDLGTCIGRDSTYTNITVSKPTGFAGPDQVMCFDAGARLIAVGGVTYSWENWDKTFTSIQASPLVNPVEDDGYVVTITDANGCKVKDTVNVEVIPGMDLKFEYAKFYDCFSRPTLSVENLTDPSENVFFDFGDGTTSDLDETKHDYSTDGVFTVRLVGTKESCIYETFESVPIFELKVPNVITPDDHPENNTFVLLYGGNKLSASALKAHVIIYNRWGGKVYESADYQDDWDGKNVEAGVYYYSVEVEGEATCKGWVHVVK